MNMDIRPNPIKPSVSGGEPEEIKEKKWTKEWLLDERRLRVLLFGVTFFVAVVCVLVWYVLGAPGISTGMKRAIGKLPTATDRDVPEVVVEKSPREESPISGMVCETYNRRPIGVMMPSDVITRPASGFAFADAVIEMPALVSNVTRLLAIFQCEHPSEIGSVRSARHDYLFIATGFDAVIAHWGGSYHALNRIRVERSVYESLSALGTGQQAFYRKPGIPAPHNGYTSYDRLWNALVAAGYRQETQLDAYEHVSDAPLEQRGAGGTITIGWPGAMRVQYEYDRETNTYARYWGGQRHLDAVEDRPVSPKVVVIAHTRQRLAVPGQPYNDVDVEGSGEAEIFQNGQEITATWEKSEIHKQDPLVFRDEEGNTIPFVRGQLWIHFVDEVTPVAWTPE